MLEEQSLSKVEKLLSLRTDHQVINTNEGAMSGAGSSSRTHVINLFLHLRLKNSGDVAGSPLIVGLLNGTECIWSNVIN